MNFFQKVLFLSVIVMILAVGCATTGEKMSRLESGMTKEDVIDILGRPDGFKKEGEYEALQYSHRLVTGWAWDRADYYVILRNGKVVEYGTGEVRVKEHTGGNILFLVPLK